jgi:hypothetical protein
MNDRDVDKLLEQALSGSRAPDVFRQRVLRDSMAALGAGRAKRAGRRAVSLSAAAVLIAAVSFLSGRVSAPRVDRETRTVAGQPAVDGQTVSVPNELVAWLEAARFFKRLGMDQRVSLAYERAGELVPHEMPLAGDGVGITYATQTETDEAGSTSAGEKTTAILAQSLGG